MPVLNSRVDAYIEAAPHYAKPILEKVRKLFHKACPQLEETMKWSVPHFDYKGVIAGLSAHKKHINLVFSKAPLMKAPAGLFLTGGAMNPIRRESIGVLPNDTTLLAYIVEAVELNEAGAKVPANKPKAPKQALPVPKDLAAALKGNT